MDQVGNLYKDSGFENGPDWRPWGWKLPSVVMVTEQHLVSQPGASGTPIREQREPNTPEGRCPLGVWLAGPPVADGLHHCPKGRQGCPGCRSPVLLQRARESCRPSRFQTIVALVSQREDTLGKLRMPSIPQGTVQLCSARRREAGTEGSNTSGQPRSLHCPVWLLIGQEGNRPGAESNPLVTSTPYCETLFSCEGWWAHSILGGGEGGLGSHRLLCLLIPLAGRRALAGAHSNP